uniref:CW-type domain-containing protein n=1 Tax=Macrostomum lignano TaxID=282301 RepID=A0A1I8F502_9PLAT
MPCPPPCPDACPRSLASDSVMDIYEALTAAVYLIVQRSNPLKVSRESRTTVVRAGPPGYTLAGPQTRLRTWSRAASSTFTPEELEAKEDDHVKCFFCDLGLKDWDAGDVPEMEHAKFSPLCLLPQELARSGMACAGRVPDLLTTRRPAPDRTTTSCSADSVDERAAQRAGGTLCASWDSADTKVLLCIARKFIRVQAEVHQNKSCLQEMHKEWDREMAGEPSTSIGKFDLAAVLRQFRDSMASVPGPPAGSQRQSR